MHPELLAIVRDRRLKRAERELLLYVYGHTNGTLEAAIEVDQVLDDLEISEGTLRRMRTNLEGWMRSRQRGNLLECEIERRVIDRHERAENARPDHENAQKTREESAQKTRETGDAKRAENARNAQKTRVFEGASKRENGAGPIGIVNNKAGRHLKPASQPGDARGDDRALAVLLAAGVSEWAALKFAGLGLEAVARHVAGWQRAKRNGKRLGAGALVNQLEGWPVPADVTGTDLQEGVLEGLITDEDLDEWRVERPRDWRDGYDVPDEWEGLIRH